MKHWPEVRLLALRLSDESRPPAMSLLPSIVPWMEPQTVLPLGFGLQTDASLLDNAKTWKVWHKQVEFSWLGGIWHLGGIPREQVRLARVKCH